MMRKLRLLLTILVLPLLLDGCMKQEIDELRRDLAEQAERIAALERWAETTNANIESLRAIIDAVVIGDYVTGVTPLVESGVQTGYVITFLVSDPITIYHGAKGDKGDKGDTGATGAAGKDGVTPLIGVAQDPASDGPDGPYYWTLDKQDGAGAQFLTDTGGNKLRVTGNDGKDGQDGQDGQDGKDGQDGQDGQDGKDGKDAVAPQIRINTGTNFWEISTDDGQNWTSTGVKATGADGAAGAQGPKGDPGESVFKTDGVDAAHEDYVVFTLADDTQITVPKFKAVGIEFEPAARVGLGESVVIPYTLTSQHTQAVAASGVPAGWTVDIDPAGKTLTVTAPEYDRIDGKNAAGTILIFATDGGERTAMRALQVTAISPRPVIDPVCDGDTKITGTGIPGAFIIELLLDGTPRIASALVLEDGTWEANTGAPVSAGVLIEASQEIPGFDESERAQVTAMALQRTAMPAVDPVDPWDTRITGTGLPEAEIKVTFSGVANLYHTQCRPDGSWTIDSPRQQPGDVISVTQTEGGKYRSYAVRVTVGSASRIDARLAVSPWSNDSYIYNYVLLLFKNNGMLEGCVAENFVDAVSGLPVNPIPVMGSTSIPVEFPSVSAGTKTLFALANAPQPLWNELAGNTTLTLEELKEKVLNISSLDGITSDNSDFGAGERGMLLTSPGRPEEWMIEEGRRYDPDLPIVPAVARLSLVNQLPPATPGIGGLSNINYGWMNVPNRISLVEPVGGDGYIYPLYYDMRLPGPDKFFNYLLSDSPVWQVFPDPGDEPTVEYALENANARPGPLNSTMLVIRAKFAPGDWLNKDDTPGTASSDYSFWRLARTVGGVRTDYLPGYYNEFPDNIPAGYEAVAYPQGICYYHVYPGEEGLPYPQTYSVRRNHLYTVTLKGVADAGVESIRMLGGSYTDPALTVKVEVQAR